MEFKLSENVRVKDINLVPESLRELYVKDDQVEGEFFIPGVTTKDKEKEFRESAKSKEKLLAERDAKIAELQEFKKQFEGHDKEKIEKLIQSLQDEKKSKLLEIGDPDKIALESDVFKQLQTNYKGLEGKLGETNKKLSQILLDKEAISLAAEAGITPEAQPFILAAIKQNFKFDGEKIVQHEGVNLTKEDGSLLSMSEFIKTRTPKQFFAPNKGGGATGNDSTDKYESDDNKSGIQLAVEGLKEISNQ